MFYRTAPGKVVRTRKPAEVVREMRFLLEEHGISIFLFQDDDFSLFGPAWQRWAREFVNELYRITCPVEPSGKSIAVLMLLIQTCSSRCGAPAFTWSTWASSLAPRKA
jgi:hypothetical protein